MVVWHKASGEPRVARRSVPIAALERSNKMRRASTSRSPRGVPAVCFKSTVGSCSILASAALVAASTCSHSSSVRSASWARWRSSSLTRSVSRRARSDEMIGAAPRWRLAVR